MTFEELGLLPELLKAVAEAGYTEPTPIQARAIPVVLLGKDVMGCAQTGTGKTAGFVLPLLQRLAHHANTSPSPARHPVRALILTPTRELAMQVHESVQTYGKYIPLRDLVVYGGVDIKPQIEAFRKGAEIVVATPGRLLDHVEQKSVGFGNVEVLVLDEADRMLDMGFIPDIKRILALLPKQRQSLLFSATFSEEIKKLANAMLREPVPIEVARRNALTETVSHRIHPVAQADKRALLAHLLKSADARQVLVFVGTKFGASRLARYLEKQGIDAAAIHGDKSQQQRTQTLEAFKNGTLRVLVATDVAARGLDIDDLPHVINYELPHVPEDYVHRIGRTGRAGRPGDATSLVCAEERGKLAEIEKLIGHPIEQVVVPGFAPEPEFYDALGKGRRSRAAGKEEGQREALRREPRQPRQRRDKDDGGRRPRYEAHRIEPAPPKPSELGFDPSKPYEPKVGSGDTAPAEPKRERQRPKRPLPALLGGLPKPEPEK
jgi:ATP-dependent RNA helicase RhlE